jgi:hypothetical protein
METLTGTGSGVQLLELLSRMRTGDRAAAADFMDRYGSRMRRRIHAKLSQPMRRLFDSMEIMSTLARRLDHLVGAGQLQASTEGQLWSLLTRMADHAVVDKARIFRRLQSVEAEDAGFAQTVQRRLRWAEEQEPDGATVEIDHALHLLADPVDRTILSLWLADTPHVTTAEWVGLSPAAVRQRWSVIRSKLREAYKEGA